MTQPYELTPQDISSLVALRTFVKRRLQVMLDTPQSWGDSKVTELLILQLIELDTIYVTGELKNPNNNYGSALAYSMFNRQKGLQLAADSWLYSGIEEDRTKVATHLREFWESQVTPRSAAPLGVHAGS